VLTMDASGPTTVQPVMPVEPVTKFVKKPFGTKGVSKLPLTMLFARAADAAKTSTKTPKITFQVRMRITSAERGQIVVWRSELLATRSIMESSLYWVSD